MYYLVTGDMSTYYGYGDREEVIIYHHTGTFVFEDLDDARTGGQDMTRDGEIEGWVLLGPQTNGSTWRGLVYNDTGEDIVVSPTMVMRKREGYDPLTGEILEWNAVA